MESIDCKTGETFALENVKTLGFLFSINDDINYVVCKNRNAV